MRRIGLVISTAALVCAVPAMPQHHGHAAHAGHAADHAPNAYAGMQHRSIKALSEQELQGLQAGKGMGLAMAAELNGYPGPLHVLELATALQLSPAQLQRTQALRAEMQAEAQAVGAELIAAEAALDRLFRDKTVTPDSLSAAVAHAAQLQGQLRATHLRYHLVMLDVLSPAQVAAYAQLRGY